MTMVYTPHEIGYSLQYGIVPNKLWKIRFLGEIAMYKYAVLHCPFLGRWTKVELSNPFDDEIMQLQDLDPIWEKHAAKQFEKHYEEILPDMKAILLKPFQRIYNGFIMLVISKPGEFKVPRFMCHGCCRFFSDKFNKRRCMYSHRSAPDGKLEKYQSSYDEVHVMKWWDSLSHKDRIDIIGTDEIATSDTRLSVLDVSGRQLVMMLQASLEFTALLRQVNDTISDFPQVLHAHAVANRLIQKFPDDCANSIMSMEIEQLQQVQQRYVRRLIKSARTSDVAFRKLMQGIDFPGDWSQEEEEDLNVQFSHSVQLIE